MADTIRHTLTLRPATLDDLTISSPAGKKTWNRFLVYFLKSQLNGSIEGPKYIREQMGSAYADQRLKELKAQFDEGMVYVAATSYELEIMNNE